jgi:hypothetical protein
MIGLKVIVEGKSQSMNQVALFWRYLWRYERDTGFLPSPLREHWLGTSESDAIWGD